MHGGERFFDVGDVTVSDFVVVLGNKRPAARARARASCPPAKQKAPTDYRVIDSATQRVVRILKVARTIAETSWRTMQTQRLATGLATGFRKYPKSTVRIRSNIGQENDGQRFRVRACASDGRPFCFTSHSRFGSETF